MGRDAGVSSAEETRARRAGKRKRECDAVMWSLTTVDPQAGD